MKKTLFCMMALLAACAVRADLLYWTVGDSAPNYNFAALKATSGTAAADGTVVGPLLTSGSATTVQADIIGDYVGKNFYIELMDATGSAVAVSDMLLASTAANYMEINGAPPAGGAWTGGSYTAVPEPTSALLMLLGMAGLALKRKQVA